MAAVTVDAIVERYQQYADEWRAKGRLEDADAMEEVIARLKDGRAVDPRTIRLRPREDP